MMYPKKKRIKSEKYLAWVRTLECSKCGQPAPSMPHHIKGVGSFSGTSMKASDYLAMPLCGDCHTDFHSLVPYDFLYDQYRLIVKTIDRAFQEGVIKT